MDVSAGLVHEGINKHGLTIAIVVHVYYPAQFEQIAEKLNAILAENTSQNRCHLDIHITLPTDKQGEVLARIQQRLPMATIHFVKNDGMDLLPFFTLMPSLQHYDWVLKLHTKNSNNDLNKLWFDTVIEGLVGTPSLFFTTLRTLVTQQTWGMAGLLPFFLSSDRLKLANQANTEKLANLWQLDISQEWGFFAGSFYWVRPQVLLKFSQLLTPHSDWFRQEFAHDGQMAHAVERLITKAVQSTYNIGLLYPQLSYDTASSQIQTTGELDFYLEANHSFAINKAFSHLLLQSYQSLVETVVILSQANLLDTTSYAKKTGISFPSTKVAYEHFALVGQFSNFASMVLPIALKRKQEKLFSWQKLKEQQRVSKRVSIIIPVFNEVRLTLRCLEAIRKHTVYSDYEVIVVDNGSEFITHKALLTYAKIHKKFRVFQLNKNLNFSIGCNYGFSKSTGEYVLFLNNDTEVTQGWLNPLVNSLEQLGVVMTQPLLCYPDKTVQCAGIEFGADGFGYERLNGKPLTHPDVKVSQACSALTGACMLLRADDFAQLEGFDTWFVNGQEDVDLCLRLKTLYPNGVLWYEATSLVVHATSQTVGRRNFINQNRQIFKHRTNPKNYNQDKDLTPMANITSVLALANEAFQQEKYKLAEQLYLYAYQQNPALKEMLEFNLRLTLYRLSERPLQESAVHILEKTKAQKSLLDKYKTEVILQLNQFTENNIQLESGLFTSLTADPFLLCKESLDSFHAGLYSISFDVFANTNVIGQLARIYIDYGEGFSEEYKFNLPIKMGRNERVIYLPRPPKQFRFDPLEITTSFALLNFEVATLNDSTITDYFNKITKVKEVDANVSLLDSYFAYDSYLNERKGNDYNYWIKVNEQNRPEAYELKQLISHFDKEVLFSIVMPTYNTEEKYLRECLDSILKQSFTNFEICIADDNSPDKRVKEVLDEYVKAHKQVKVVYRKANGHISEATNSALALAKGKYIVLIDHDDLLAQDALYYVAQVIKENADAKIIYTDEDKVDEYGNRSNPHFKSDWNYDLFLSQNYVSHLGVYEKKLIDKIKGFRKGVEGSQDQDLLLRCLPYVKPNQIVHIPKVLYHWRAISGSTATGAGEKDYTTNAGIKALQDYLKNNFKEKITVEKGKVPNTYKVNWAIPNPAPKVSLLIPTRDAKDITEQAVRSILDKTTYPNYHIVILDNGSEKRETLKFFEKIQKEDKRVTVLKYDYPFNYSAINNFGVKYTNGEIIGLINNDVEVINGEWLTEMVSHAIRPDVGCVGAKLYYANGQIQHAGVITSLGGVAGHSHKHFPREAMGYFHRLVLVQNLTAVTAACLLVRRDVYNEVGGLNEKDLTVAFNDVDFCLKVYTAGYRNVWTPYAELYHHESISRGAEDNPEKIARFNKEMDYMKRTWGNLLKLDPHYSPNLTRAREDFSINLD